MWMTIAITNPPTGARYNQFEKGRTTTANAKAASKMATATSRATFSLWVYLNRAIR